MSRDEIMDVLARFQDGYGRRDPKAIDGFMELFDDSEELEVIGTNAVYQGKGEWSYGPGAARKLVLDDWREWGDLELDLENAAVRSLGDTGWVSMYGILKKELAPGRNCREFLDYAKTVKYTDENAQETLANLLRLGGNTAYHAQKGGEFTWPLRITAVLTRSAGEWRFAQMHFSFCTNDFPDVRF